MAAITTAMCNSFKTELLTGTHNFTNGTGDTFKFVLIKSGYVGPNNSTPVNEYNKTFQAFGSAAGTPTITNLGTDAHASTGDYNSTSGVSLTSATPALSTDTAVCDFTDLSLTGTTISADGAIIYNSSKSNKACAVYSFGGTKTTTAGTFTVTFPAADASNAIIRIG